ncbi:hypothetical protein PR048_024591 [Dryococelus australis]|uniref:Uncharacterized protein n=1 Tax=Dryococelus australis TaxID=614101 RepID=A0ABQ9GP28_9NEOP|nr:hypothetical protein PR048_024591 [Dryococelus australis]
MSREKAGTLTTACLPAPHKPDPARNEDGDVGVSPFSRALLAASLTAGYVQQGCLKEVRRRSCWSEDASPVVHSRRSSLVNLRRGKPRGRVFSSGALGKAVNPGSCRRSQQQKSLPQVGNRLQLCQTRCRYRPAKDWVRRISLSGLHQGKIAGSVCPIADSRLPQQPPGTTIKVGTFQLFARARLLGREARRFAADGRRHWPVLTLHGSASSSFLGRGALLPAKWAVSAGGDRRPAGCVAWGTGRPLGVTARHLRFRRTNFDISRKKFQDEQRTFQENKGRILCYLRFNQPLLVTAKLTGYSRCFDKISSAQKEKYRQTPGTNVSNVIFIWSRPSRGAGTNSALGVDNTQPAQRPCVAGRNKLITEQHRNEGAEGKRDISEKTRRPAASSGTIPTCDNPGVTPLGIEPGSLWWEASSLTTTPPRLHRLVTLVAAHKRAGTMQGGASIKVTSAHDDTAFTASCPLHH